MKRLRARIRGKVDTFAALTVEQRDELFEHVVGEVQRIVEAVVADRHTRAAVYEHPKLDAWPIIVRGGGAVDRGGEPWGDQLWGWPANVSPKDAIEAYARADTSIADDARAMLEKLSRPDEREVAPVAEHAGVIQAVMRVARDRGLLFRVLLVVSAANEFKAARDEHVRVPTAILSTLTSARGGAVQRVESSSDAVFTTMDLRKLAVLEGHAEGRVEKVDGRRVVKSPIPSLSRAVFDVRPSGRLHAVQLSLPLFADSGDKLADLRRFLNDWELRAYLGMFALLKPDTGRDFLLDESRFLLDELGLTPRLMPRERLGLPPYARPRDGDERRLRVAIEKLQSTVITKVVDPRGDIKLEKPERLIEKVNRYTASGASAEWYQHSLAAWKLAQVDFVQMPRAAMRLDAEHAALAAGVALVMRDHAQTGARWLEEGRGVSLPLEQWARLAGEPVDVRVRDRGRAWWGHFRAKLAKAVDAGGFGRLLGPGGVELGKVTGNARPDQLVDLAPSGVLVNAYAPLLGSRDRAVERADLAKHEAEVRKLIKPGRRRKRPS